LKAIAEAVNAGLDTAERSLVSFYSPDELIVELRKLAASVAPPPPIAEIERTTRGYKVRRHGPQMSPEERKATEAAAIQIIADTMKRKG
jgi:hypothetical protein